MSRPAFEVVYGLVHSPLVGETTWSLVAKEMERSVIKTIVPKLADRPDSGLPFWKQHAQSAADAFAGLDRATPVVLVAHSGAGPLLPAIRSMLDNPVLAYVFVDAGLPLKSASRLEAMALENHPWAEQLRVHLWSGDKYPEWSEADLREEIPKDRLRERVAAEVQPRDLSFFTEPIPVFDGWPDAPCGYIRFSPPYESSLIKARQAGWPVIEMNMGHFHMLVDSKAVSEAIITIVNELTSQENR